MAVVDMLRETARLRKLPGRCRMCTSTKHSTQWHLDRTGVATKGRRFSKLHRDRMSFAAKERDPKTRKHSLKTRRLLSKMKMGIPTGTPNWKNPEERARKISLAQKGKPISRKKLLAIRKTQRARRNPKTTNRDCLACKGMREYRAFVKARDHHRCQQCKRTLEEMKETGTPYLVMHHINHNHEDFYLDNLITLCHGCNIMAENPVRRVEWEKRFRKYTKSIVYEVEETGRWAEMAVDLAGQKNVDGLMCYG